jgi:5-formyltetrahydrofolate cyclo-ligase
VAIPEPNLTKSKLRSTMRRLIHAQTPDSRALKAALGRWLAQHPAVTTIAAFSALQGEPDLADFITSHPSHRWVYPRVSGDYLVFHHVPDPASGLRPGAFGILEPDPALPEIQTPDIDAFICPGLAFDPRGGRLGRGRGFYDRMLAIARPDALRIGVCFPWQMVPDTCSEPHDVPMDQVLF